MHCFILQGRINFPNMKFNNVRKDVTSTDKMVFDKERRYINNTCQDPSYANSIPKCERIKVGNGCCKLFSFFCNVIRIYNLF